MKKIESPVTVLKRMLAIALVGIGMAPAGSAIAQQWPDKPIRIVVPYSAGGTGDAMARTIGDLISKELKQPVIVDNKPGGSGMIGGAACKASAPDGHNFCLFLMDIVTINPTIFKKVPYKADADFLPVAFVAESAAVLPVSASLPITNVKELMAYSKANPKSANWGSFGIGSSSHLVLEMLNKRFDASITHVPFQNIPLLITSMMTGEVTTGVAGYSQVTGFIDQKKMRAIAVLGEKRLAQLPDVPTLAEQDVDLKASFWYGMFAPAGTTPEHVRRMNEAVNRAVADPAIAKFFQSVLFTARPMASVEFGELVKRDAAIWGRIIRQANISLD